MRRPVPVNGGVPGAGCRMRPGHGGIPAALTGESCRPYTRALESAPGVTTMRAARSFVSVWRLLSLAASGLADGGAPGRGSGGTPPAPPPPAAAAASLPLHFEENRGQADPGVRFTARARGFGACFTDAGALFVLPRAGGEGTACDLLRMEFPGARPGAALAGRDPLPGRSHYFLGSDPSRWVRGVVHLASLRREGLWPGVDLLWRGLPGAGLEYAFAVAPGADPGPIAFSFEGAASLEVDAAGDLLVGTAGGVMRHRRPVAWQDGGGRRRPVAARFSPGPGGAVGILLGARDPRLPLFIDPSVEYATWLGGSDWDRGQAVAAASDGTFCVAGTTASFNFPVLLAWQGTKTGPANFGDAFLSKFAADGRSLLWSTFLGGYATEEGFAVAVDGTGAVYVAGRTTSDDYPTYRAYKGTGGSNDAFLTKLSAAGDEMIYSTRLGGNDTEYARGLAVTSNGSAVLVGKTGSSDFPKVASLQTYKGDWDAFVTRFKPDGSAPDFSTPLGGSLEDEAAAVAVTPDGAVIVTGFPMGANSPGAAAPPGGLAGTWDAFVVRIEGTPPAAVFSTYLGGAGDDEGRGAAVTVVLDEDEEEVEDAWVVGTTMSASGFPLASPLRSSLEGGSEAVLPRSSPGGTLLFPTFRGGAAAAGAAAVGSDAWGGVYVAGTTASYDFPASGEIQTSMGGATDAFVTLIDPAGPRIHSSTFYGGSGAEEGTGVAVDGSGMVRFVGTTASSNLPVAGPLAAAYGGGTSDAFVAGFPEIPFPPRDCSVSLTGLRSVEVTWTDACMGETSFLVERSVAGGAFSTVGSTGAGITVFGHAGLDPSTEYAYRVRASNAEGTSPPSGPDSVLTPAVPTLAPATPGALAAVASGPRRVELSWLDNSDNEDFFVVARGTDGITFDTLATPRLGTTSWVDDTAEPDRTYHYMVMAVNPIGPSMKSNTAVVTLPSTLSLSVVKGRIKDKEGGGKDSVKLTGVFGFGEGSEAQEFHPMARSTALRIGGWEGSRVLFVEAGDQGWKTKKGKWTWKSPAGSLSRAKVSVVAETGVFTVSLSKLTLAPGPANPIRVTLVLGTDSVTLEEPWLEARKPGDFRK